MDVQDPHRRRLDGVLVLDARVDEQPIFSPPRQRGIRPRPLPRDQLPRSSHRLMTTESDALADGVHGRRTSRSPSSLPGGGSRRIRGPRREAGDNGGQKSRETPATAGLKGGRLVGPGVERNRNDRDAPGCPHGPVSAGYAATSSASASRSKRVPLELPQRRTRPLFTI